jgi:hypothetical protein
MAKSVKRMGFGLGPKTPRSGSEHRREFTGRDTP